MSAATIAVIQERRRQRSRRKTKTHHNPKMVVHPNKPLEPKEHHRREFWIWLFIFTAFVSVTRFILRNDFPARWEQILNLADHSALLVEVFTMAVGDEG